LDPLEIPASHVLHVATQGKKWAPGQILGGLLTILLMAAKKPNFIAPRFAFYQCGFSERRCRDHFFEAWQLVANVVQSQLPWLNQKFNPHFLAFFHKIKPFIGCREN